MSPSPDGPTNAAEVVETLAREAGLSPALRATVAEAAAAAAGEVSVSERFFFFSMYLEANYTRVKKNEDT